MKILGFDLGDGESALSVLDGESTVDPRMIPLQGKSSLLSAVGQREGRIVVGEEASVLSGAREVHVRFKSGYLTDPDSPMLIRSFAQGVFAEAMRQDPALMAQVTRTVAGCPAGWGEARRQQYAALIESAGFPNVCVTPEPRAAFLYARHARGLRIDPELMRKSAMVVDIGSSTTDFAYIVDGHQQELSMFGDVSLGGGLLDELILRRSVAASPDREALESAFAESAAWKSYCELEARRLKERYFLDEDKWKETPLTSSVLVCYRDPVMLTLSVGAADMEEMIREPVPALGGVSFLECLNRSLSASVRAAQDNPPRVVILTGGASRMRFFRDACREAFGEIPMVLCPEPECSIARGLAYAGRVDELLKGFRSDVASIARGDTLSAAVGKRVHELYGPIASAVYEVCEEQTLEVLNLWKKGSVKNVEQMQDVLRERMEKALTGGAAEERLRACLAPWTKELMRELEDGLSRLCLRYGVPPEQLTLAGTVPETKLGEVDLSLLDAMGMDYFSGFMGIVLAAVGASLCGGGGIALVSTGLPGMFIGAFAGILLAVVGRAGMEKMILRAEVPVPLRQLVTASLVKRGLSRQRTEIENAIIRELSDPRNGFINRLCAELGNTLGAQLEEMAKKAEMSVGT